MKLTWGLCLAAGAAIFLRLLGIQWGLPHTFNADEPHIVNLAVSFGSGSLRPYAFKYPTLWPYLLFISYGVYFLIWSGFDLRRSVTDFLGLFIWDPTGFYLIGRLLAAALSLLGVWVVWRTEQEKSPGSWGIGALTLAFSPVLVELAHSCKPDCLMFFFACLAWRYGLRIYWEGRRNAYWACGIFLGLAASSQYTALPLVVVLPLTHYLGRGSSSRRWLGESLGLFIAAFLMGSPFILLDFPRFWFWVGMRSTSELTQMGLWNRWDILGQVLVNIWGFASIWSIAGLAALVGLINLFLRERALGLIFGIPIVLYIAILTNNPDGGWPRYVLGCFPAMALLAAKGLSLLKIDERPRLARFSLTLMLLPGTLECLHMGFNMRLPDTRQQAEIWIQAHIPQGAVLLMDQSHASPRLPMTLEQIQELREKTLQMGSPRWRLYQGMTHAHPGGGYRIYRIQRSAKDLGTFHPKQVQLSQADHHMLDLGTGLDNARKVGVEYVVTSSFGATPQSSPELSIFFEELKARCKLLAVFSPEPGRRSGPTLGVYHLP